MKGFFEDEKVIGKDANCVKCKLYKGCESPKMKATGKGEKKILVVAEAPSRKEDERGEQLIGEAGQVLRKVLRLFDIDLDKDCWKTYAVNCRPPKNKTPTKSQIKHCHPRLERVLKKKKPKLILLLGGVAVESFINNRLAENPGGINRWRGFAIPDQRYKAWVMATFHPSFILRSHGDIIIKNLFKRDIEKGLKKLKKKLPIYGDYNISLGEPAFCIPDPRHVDLLAFDYETTGVKPYAEGHEIVCGAFSYKEDEAFAFEMGKDDDFWKDVLRDKRIKKTAHNLKFEHVWGKEILKTTTRGWVWDSMEAAHILDNRRKITDLKFQAYINFGQEDYSSHLDKFIKTDKEGFNKIREALIADVLKYCAMDALLQFKLAKKQMRRLR